MDLNTICFMMFGFLLVGYFVLEGFDYGAGMLLPYFGKSDAERQAVVKTLAPVWEGNEVWLVAAGAFLFAAFPVAYATLFSGLYIAFLLLLGSLILRGVAFEFRDKENHRLWRRFWDWALFAGSVTPALLWGVITGSLLSGLPIDAGGQYAGTFRHLLTPYAVTGGLVFMLLFLVHGAAYLILKLEGAIADRLTEAAPPLCKYALAALVVWGIMLYAGTSLSTQPVASFVLLLPVGTLALVVVNLKRRHYAKTFIFSGATIVLLNLALVLALYPRIAVSSLNPQWSLDIYNTAANQLALRTISGVMLAALPVILLLEGWKYYIFRHKINAGQAESATDARLTQTNHELRTLIKQAHCLADIINSFRQALKSSHGSVIKRLKPKHKALLLGNPNRKPTGEDEDKPE